MIKNRKMINFLDEKKEEKYFKCVLIILIYLLIFQGYRNIQSVKNLNDEIKNNKMLIQQENLVNNDVVRSTLIKDTHKIYKSLGLKNIDRLLVEKNKVKIKGKCKNLDLLEKLKSMDNIKNLSITNIKHKGDKFYFNATYEVGGIK